MWLVAKRYSRVGLIMEEVMVASREAASRFIGEVNTEETRHNIAIAMREVYMELSKKHPAYYDYEIDPVFTDDGIVEINLKRSI